MSRPKEDDRVILNVGGVKYETYRSTLTAYPDTLLGTMFQERNREFRQPNGNEHFFDRNGKAFHYIMEYYRTGKILWLETNSSITKQELQIEMDFFQISCELPKPTLMTTTTSVLHRKSFPKLQEILQDFIESIKSCVYETSWNLRDRLSVSFYSYNNEHCNLQSKRSYIGRIEDILGPFRINGYRLLKEFKLKIEEELRESIQELIYLEITHKHEYIGVHHTTPPLYRITVKIQSPIYNKKRHRR